MRLLALLVMGILVATPVAGQESQPSSSAPPPPSSNPDGKTAPAPDFSVSLGRIREQLERPAARPLLKSFDDRPTFRVEIRERLKIEELLATLDFKTGPTPAGGVYAYEQQRLLFPPSLNPLAQPYAAFSQGQLVTILVENLVGKYLAGKAVSAVSTAVRENAEAAARREVDDAIAEYCAARADNGTGVPLCAATPPHAR
jgi:hypothetical protein